MKTYCKAMGPQWKTEVRITYFWFSVPVGLVVLLATTAAILSQPWPLYISLLVVAASVAVSFVRANVQLHQHMSGQLVDADKRLGELGARLKPRLEFVFGEGEPYRHEELIGNAYHSNPPTSVRKVSFWVGVKNTGGKTIDSVSVRLESLGPGKQLILTLRRGFYLDPGEEELVHVVRKTDDIGGPPSKIIEIIAKDGVSTAIPIGRYRLGVRAYGHNVPSFPPEGLKWFTLSVNSNGELLFQPEDTGS